MSIVIICRIIYKQYFDINPHFINGFNMIFIQLAKVIDKPFYNKIALKYLVLAPLYTSDNVCVVTDR